MTKKKKNETLEIEFPPNLKNITLEEKVNLLIANQENITKVKAKDLKELIIELEIADFVDQQHYCSLLIESLDEEVLKHKNCQKLFASDTIKEILKSIL